jgi:signal transduction histidine kinase/ligand-binding sensor domain-containing protein/AraC-like DNA-binding protein
MVWVGSVDGGLHRFNPETEQYTHYIHDPYNPTSLPSNRVHKLFEDRAGILWVGTLGGGLAKFDSENERFISYHNDPEDPNSLSSELVTKFFEDRTGKQWIGTSEGLNAFDWEKGRFIHYKNDPDDPNSISDNVILCINEDRSGNLWLGTWGGVNKIDLQKNQFTHIRHIPGNKNSLSDNYVTSVYESLYGGEDVLWIGTKNGGLNKLNRSTGKWSCYKHDPQNSNSLISNFVYSICEDHTGIIWVGNFLGGLNKLDPRTGKINRYPYDPQNPNSLTCQSVRSIVEDENGLLWIGTQSGGINTFNPVTEQFKLVSHKMYVIDIYKDRSGDLWFGTMGGLKKYDRPSGKYLTYRHNPDDSTSLSYRDVQSMYESNSGEFWVGTFGGGLNLFDRKSGKFTHFSVKDGLPSDIIFGILEDKQNNLWISTTKGISKFNPKTKEFKNYDHRDGLISGEPTELSCFQDRNGQMFFATTNGLNAFYPEDISDNSYIPPVVITNFKIFNKPVSIKKDGLIDSQGDYVLPGHISTLNKITLSYKESVFSFEFAALNYHSPQKNRYAYKMHGVDPEWVFTDASRRYATYTNLDPGEYVFKVKGSNNNGVWNEEGTSIKIIITPPWWKSNLAYTIYLFLFVLIVFVTWRRQLKRIHIKQQLKMEHFEAEKLREVDHLKSRFFANISHEFRTPLTLIQGPVKDMLTDEFNEKRKRHYQTILRYSDRLLNLINQILDLSKLESGRMKLKVNCTDVTQFLKDLVQSFSSWAVRKKITLKFEAELESISGYVDRDKLEKIVTNLLSNAFKFSPEGGDVEVALNIPPNPPSKGGNAESPFNKGGHRGISISIFNSGVGIPTDQLDKIFDRFYQADESYAKDSEGSGIGLALTKELVEAHHGEIRVESELNKSTTFTVWLPIEKEHFKSEEIVEGDVDVVGKQRSPLPMSLVGEKREIETIESTPIEPPVDIDKSAPLLLIVEDNPDVTSYISGFLEKDYRIFSAENGEEGLKKALDKFPDLIISDVMMPVMDGFELCRKLKSDERTSHIPVILLTAKADMDSKVEGLEFGADDYVTKPFDAKELDARAKNLIDQRRILREKFSRMIEVKPGEIAASSMDEQFFRRLLDVFEDHVAQSDFGTEDFAREVGMSRSNLHLKLKALTNQSTHEFLRTMRLKRAAQLLKKSAGNVTEIAYAVGFTNPSHFSKIFRQQFGQTPSEFACKNQNMETPERNDI